MQKLAEGVFIEEAYSSANVGLIALGSGWAMVDAPALPSQARLLRERAASLGELRYLLLTDHHRGHAWGSAFFPGEVVGHRLTREKMFYPEKALEQIRSFFAQADPEGAKEHPKLLPRMPTLTFAPGLALHLGQGQVELLHTPGHTPNTIGVYLPAQGLVFTGDTLVHGFSPYLGEANLADWLGSLARLEALEASLYIPGHGEPCGKEVLASLRGYLEELRGRVAGTIAQGFSREEAIAELELLGGSPFGLDPAPGAPERFRAGVGRVYDQLREERTQKA